jgi:uncharacterized delta-60 repeat protein
MSEELGVRAWTSARQAVPLLAAITGSLLVLVLAAAPKTYAAPGDLDPSFSRDGKVVAFTSGIDTGTPGISDIALQADGSIVGASNVGVVRFNSDGTWDDSFSTGPDGPPLLTALALQPDGKIVVAGYDYRYPSDFTVARHDPDGGLDETFAGDGIATLDFGGGDNDDEAHALALQPDGKIVVAGYTVEVGWDDRDFALARYNPDGTLDNTFSGDGMLTTGFPDDTPDNVTLHHDMAHDVALQPDGKIVVSGSASGDFAMARYDEDGDLDPAFSGDGRATVGFTDSEGAGARAIAIQPDGKIVAAGGTSGEFALARFDTDGSVDAGFGVDGVVTTSFGQRGYQTVVASDVVLEAGRLLAAGRAHGDFALARYGLGGALDPGFSGDGRLTTDMGYSDGASSIAVQPDGRIAVGGTAFYTDGNLYAENYGAVARYLTSDGPADADADGVLDSGDLCPQIFVPGESDGCRRIRRSISLYVSTGKDRSFHGYAHGPWGCTDGSRVRIYQLKRGGRRVKVGSDRLSYDPDYGWYYRSETKRTRGRYRAKLRRELEPDVGWCSGAKSDVVRIPRK